MQTTQTHGLLVITGGARQQMTTSDQTLLVTVDHDCVAVCCDWLRLRARTCLETRHQSLVVNFYLMMYILLIVETVLDAWIMIMIHEVFAS